MKTMTRSVALAAVFTALAACGGGGTSSSGPTETVPAATLQTKMLTVADVGAAWKLGHEVTELDFGDATKSPCEDAGLNPTIAARLTPVAGVQFEPVDGSYRHLIEFAVTGEVARLTTDVQLFAEGYELCNGKPADGGTAGVTITKLTIPKLGDQRYAYTVFAKLSPDEPTVWYGRSVLVRVGTVMVTVGLTEILDSPAAKPTVTDAALVTIVEKAVAHLTT